MMILFMTSLSLILIISVRLFCSQNVTNHHCSTYEVLSYAETDRKVNEWLTEHVILTCTTTDPPTLDWQSTWQILAWQLLKFRDIIFLCISCTMQVNVSVQIGANAQPDGRPAEHRWCPLFNAAKFGWRPLLDAMQ